MNPIQIGRKRLSEIVWGIIDERVSEVEYEVIERIIEEQQACRSSTDYNAGSVSYDDAIELYRIVKYFRPHAIAEVGTFIGVSTLTMNLALERLVDIYTCDASSGIDLNVPNIFQYPNKPSYEMFADMAEKGVRADLIYLDGRLGQQDYEPLTKIVHDDTVFIFGDFEGVEKGVINAMMVESGLRVLIYPRENKKTAISIPFTLLRVVPQEII
jgi:hypothetical protein